MAQRRSRITSRTRSSTAVKPRQATSSRKRYSQPERALHAHVFTTLTWFTSVGMLKCVWFPVPNQLSGLVGPKLAAILKGQGQLKAGVSDFIFMWGDLGGCNEADIEDGNVSTCGAIELKIGTNDLNEDQETFRTSCWQRGIPFEIARSIDDVVAILVSWDRLPANAIEKIRGVVPAGVRDAG